METHFPSSANIETIHNFYTLLLNEVEQAGYNEQEKALLANRRSYYGRYLHPPLRPYFVETVIPHIAHVIPFLVTGQSQPYIFDLGCGLGMQSIIFASLGARVVGMDVRGESIALCHKRKAYYEKQLNRELEIQFIHRDFLSSDPAEFDTRFDSLFSMAAFSCIRPLEQTAKLVSAILKQDAKIYLYEKNSDHLLNKVRSSPEPSPQSTVKAFEEEGFIRRFLYGACALPSPFWQFPSLNQSLVHPVNRMLKKSLPLSFNYVLGMQRATV